MNATAAQRASALAPSANALLRMTQTTPTCLWNDSADPDELSSAIGWGAVGATCNPVIALSCLNNDLPRWQEEIRAYAAAHPSATESQIGWQMVRQLSAEGARLLEPIFREQRGRNGRLSIQTDPRLYRDQHALVEQAVDFSRLAPNIIIKLPATQTGLIAIEECTYRGLSINATVSFTLSQALAVADAVERGLRRRAEQGLDVGSISPVCTLMLGRLDDWLKVLAARDRITLDPGYLEWAGVAVFKKAYRIFRERCYRTRLLSAAFRNHMHWSQLIGGDVVISPPYEWQVRLNASDIEPVPRINDPVSPVIVAELIEKFPDFRAAYEEQGLAADAYESFGATRRTLRQFLAACADLELLVRDTLLPSPDN